jgi:hypothetical protein
MVPPASHRSLHPWLTGGGRPNEPQGRRIESVTIGLNRRLGDDTYRVKARQATLAVGGSIMLLLSGCLATGCALVEPSFSHEAQPRSLRPAFNPRVAQRSTSAPRCTRDSLGRGMASLQGATQEMIGAVVLTNIGTTDCSLDGMPRVVILAANGSTLVTRQQPQQLIGYPRWRGYPVVSLRPGQRVQALVRWSNACHQPTPTRLRVTWNGATWLAPMQSPAAPYCNDPSGPSILAVSRFTPSSH